MFQKFSRVPLLFLLFFSLYFAIPSSFATDYGLFVDESNLVTSAEGEKFQNELETLSQKLGVSVGVVTYRNNNTYHSWISKYGGDYILLAVNMEQREMELMVRGGTAFYSMDDGTKDYILDLVAPSFTKGDYASGISDFLDLTEDFASGNRESVVSELENSAIAERKKIYSLVALTASLLVGAVVPFGMMSTMNQVKPVNQAQFYKNEPRVLSTREIYLYKNVIRTSRQQHSGGGGSRGGGGNFSASRSRKF